MTASRVRPSGGWWVDGVLLMLFGLLTAGLAVGALLDLDVAVRDWCDAHRPAPLHLAARGLNVLGSANLLAGGCLALAGWVGVRRRSWRPVLPVVAAYLVSYLVVGPIKLLTDRSAPHAPWPDAARLFADPDGWSYPSGHVINAVIWFQVVVVLVGEVRGRALPAAVRRALRVAPAVVVSWTVTYLGYHWLTDTLAALALGLLLDRLLRRALARAGRRLGFGEGTSDRTGGSAVTERTLVLIKPDAVARGLVGEVIGRFERKGLMIEAMVLRTMDAGLAEAHYADHMGKPFYPTLVEFMTSGPLVALVVAGDQAIDVVRTLTGATDGRRAAPGTIRGDLSLSNRENLVHASDSGDAAKREIALWFQDFA